MAAYTHVSGGGAGWTICRRPLAAVLTAQALNVDWTSVISADVPTLTRSSRNAVDLLYRRDGGRQPQVLIGP